MNKRIIAIRHAECEGNVKGSILSSLTSPLSNKGIHQAEYMRKNPLFSLARHVFVTPYIRTHETANILFPNAIQKIDERLNEINTGTWKQSTWDEYFFKYPTYKNLPLIQRPAFEGGESYSDLINRVSQFWKSEILESSGDVAIVAHGGSLGALLLCALNLDNHNRHLYGAFEIPNCSGFVIQIDSARQVKITWLCSNQS